MLEEITHLARPDFGSVGQRQNIRYGLPPLPVHLLLRGGLILGHDLRLRDELFQNIQALHPCLDHETYFAAVLARSLVLVAVTLLGISTLGLILRLCFPGDVRVTDKDPGCVRRLISDPRGKASKESVDRLTELPCEGDASIRIVKRGCIDGEGSTGYRTAWVEIMEGMPGAGVELVDASLEDG